MTAPITFTASIPQIQSAIKLDGAGGARLTLDIPESEMGNFISVMTLRGVAFKVTIEQTESDGNTGSQRNNTKRAKF